AACLPARALPARDRSPVRLPADHGHARRLPKVGFGTALGPQRAPPRLADPPCRVRLRPRAYQPVARHAGSRLGQGPAAARHSPDVVNTATLKTVEVSCGSSASPCLCFWI